MASLVIGSMAPDFDYLYRTQTCTSLSHSLAGVLYYCLICGEDIPRISAIHEKR